MNRHLSNLAFVLAAVLPVALLAACNPEVVPPECHSYEDLVCADFGGRLCRGFVDLGFGCQGLASAGVRFCF